MKLLSLVGALCVSGLLAFGAFYLITHLQFRKDKELIEDESENNRR